MTAAEEVLGEVVCRHHDGEVDLLCMRCLARAHVPDEAAVLEHDAEQFLRVHRHSHPAPRHSW
jgi:hypothetical protein